MDERVAIRFKALEAKLATLYPDAIREAEALAVQVVDPSVADAHAVWQRVGDEPLFANTKIAIGVAASAKTRAIHAGGLAYLGRKGWRVCH